MDKKTEITLLQKLSKNTYFSEAFSEIDLQKMIENIQNDFPLLNDTKLSKKQNDLERHIKQMSKELDDLIIRVNQEGKDIDQLSKEVNGLRMREDAILSNLLHHGQDEIARMSWSNIYIAKKKLEFKLELSDFDANILLEELGAR